MNIQFLNTLVKIEQKLYYIYIYLIFDRTCSRLRATSSRIRQTGYINSIRQTSGAPWLASGLRQLARGAAHACAAESVAQIMLETFVGTVCIPHRILSVQLSNDSIHIYSKFLMFEYYCFGEALVEGVFAKYTKIKLRFHWVGIITMCIQL